MYLIIKAHEKMFFGLKDALRGVYLIEFIGFICVLAITGIVFGLFLSVCFEVCFQILTRNHTKVTRIFHILSKP